MLLAAALILAATLAVAIWHIRALNQVIKVQHRTIMTLAKIAIDEQIKGDTDPKIVAILRRIKDTPLPP